MPIPYANLDPIINRQLKIDRSHNFIAPHFRNLELCYENSQESHNNQQLRIHKAYPKNNCVVIIRKHQTHTDLAKYLHASCYGLVKSTFIKAILKIWPGLSEKMSESISIHRLLLQNTLLKLVSTCSPQN